MAIQKKTLVAIAFGLALAVLASPFAAVALEKKLVIVTSYPPDTTTTVKKAFEKKHPGVKGRDAQEKDDGRHQVSAGDRLQQQVRHVLGLRTRRLRSAQGRQPFAEVQGQDEGHSQEGGRFPDQRPEGYYKGFAASGYGIMWNTRYLKAKKLPEPKTWANLAKPVYHGHVGMSAPSRSGTTHLTVETLLQGKGWDKGWAELKAIAGNFKTVTERSFGVPDGVNSGQFGLGIVIDFFGLSSEASGFPVKFIYPPVTTLVPANIAIVKNAPHPKAAAAFIEFLLSPAGQEVLLDPKIRRLPVNPATYAKAPPGFPNPFKDKSIGAAVKFDLQLSKTATT